jgi:hypothetical protein
MAQNRLAERLTTLEAEVARLRAELDKLNQSKDWRSAAGMFTGDDEMMRIFEQARKIREADRRDARRKFAKPKLKAKA